MITFVVIDLLRGPPAHEDRPGRGHFVDQLRGRTGRLADVARSAEPIV
jgi:hypothetical protein